MGFVGRSDEIVSEHFLSRTYHFHVFLSTIVPPTILAPARGLLFSFVSHLTLSGIKSSIEPAGFELDPKPLISKSPKSGILL